MRGKRVPARQRAEAVGVAEVVGISEASRVTGVPKGTLHAWYHSPEYEQLRTRKTEDVSSEWWAGIQKAFRRTVELLDKTDDPVKAATAGAIMYDKRALMSGGATSRTETVSPSLPSEVQRALRERFIEVTRDRAIGLSDDLESERQPDGPVSPST